MPNFPFLRIKSSPPALHLIQTCSYNFMCSRSPLYPLDNNLPIRASPLAKSPPFQIKEEVSSLFGNNCEITWNWISGQGGCLLISDKKFWGGGQVGLSWCGTSLSEISRINCYKCLNLNFLELLGEWGKSAFQATSAILIVDTCNFGNQNPNNSMPGNFADNFGI